jgi:hypothetical protein
VAKSLFTHMLVDELPLYLRQIHRRLKQQGKGLLGFFLLNSDQRRLEGRGRSSLVFVRSGHNLPYGYRRPAAPTAAVAYDEFFVRDLLAEAGLRCLAAHYGAWSGRPNALTFQDLLVVESDAKDPARLSAGGGESGRGMR